MGSQVSNLNSVSRVMGTCEGPYRLSKERRWRGRAWRRIRMLLLTPNLGKGEEGIVRLLLGWR